MKMYLALMRQFLFWPIFFTTHLLAVSLLSWHLLAQIDFAYPQGYVLLDLHTHIQENAPKNQFKRDFEFTSAEERWALFSQITTAVQHKGIGLGDISYRLPNGSHTPLMHQAEIIHLQDVSNLIDVIYTTGIISALVCVILLFIAYRKKIIFPPLKKIVLGFIASMATISVVIIGIGATKVFYWFHTKVFPEGHQWFFYYEESLMTTLMKAPDIFAFIAGLLLSTLIFFWVLSAWGMNKLLAKRT